jgi:glycolate oxidase
LTRAAAGRPLVHDRWRELLHDLRQVLPDAAILTEREATTPYECDGLTLYRESPAVVALPERESQVSEILRLCARREVPVVPRGAGTGLSGGALPCQDGLLLSLARLNRIVSVDPAARTATVQTGVTNLAISEAARSQGLFYAPDPSSQVACTIGGNVAENSGGVHCLKYGMTLQNVLRVRGFMSDGEPLEVGAAGPHQPGLDLLPLVVGSEGMLMVVTEVTVRLLPAPPLARCIMASFASIAAAGEAVASLIAGGIIPAGLEMMDQAAIRLVEPFAGAGYDQDAAAVLLCESDGTVEEVEEEVARMAASLQASHATRIRVSADEAERQRFWAGRKSAFAAAGRAAPAYYCMDGTIPRRHLAAMLTYIQSLESRFDLRCPNVFHAGDGNLHPLIMFDDGDPDSAQRAQAFGAAILEECVRLGGTVTGEHGVGVEKLDQMCLQFERAELDAFLGVKRAFDPGGRLNPGKVVPSLRRCAEQGRPVVRQGRQPFPHLPRF